MLTSHTHTQTQMNATQQPIHPFSLVLVRQYFSILVSGSPADLLLYTVSALSRPIQTISLSEFRYSVCTGHFQYFMLTSTDRVHWVEMRCIGHNCPENHTKTASRLTTFCLHYICLSLSRPLLSV